MITTSTVCLLTEVTRAPYALITLQLEEIAMGLSLKKQKLINVGVAPHDGIFCIGISPHGLISIGAIPHGLISIGLIPMGVFSMGLVSMGILAIGQVNMAIVSAGQINMSVVELNIGEPSQDREETDDHEMSH